MSESVYGVVYALTSPSGKQYVGQTTKTIKHRIRKHNTLAEGNFQNSAIANAIRKYGINSFTILEIAQATSQEELDSLETRYISSLRTSAPHGYNLLPGGRGRSGTHQDTRKKLRKARIGRKHSPETIRKISEANKGEKNKFYGKKHSEETKRKMRAHERTPEHAAKLGNAKRGVVLSESHKEKIKTSLRFFHDKKEKTPVPHSTYAGYKRGCKCRLCLDANSRYHKKWRKQKQDGKGN